MPTLNYTTTIAAAKTIGEIQAMLAEHGADRIAVTYVERKAAGLSFSLPTAVGQRIFDLPVNVTAVHQLLTRQRAKSSRVDARPEQAERVAWRVLKDWLAAQLALIEAEMATLDQVMMPYLIGAGGLTLYQQFQNSTLELTT